MRIGWYAVHNGTRSRPWSLERRRHGAGGATVGVERLRAAGGHMRRWKYQDSAQGAADRLNREEAVS